MEAVSSPSPSSLHLSPQALACLRALAARYVWWKTPEEAMQFPSRVAAQVMNLGDWGDVVAMSEAVGDDYLRHVIKTAEAGQLNARSWHYWHYRLGLADLEANPVPPMPVRKIA
ncbi:MAG TPA: hypothetical protein VLZ50_00480 [Terracidiphilus sp.]|nr:hypothetical protein [Terracidiphilus sp.]